MPRKSPSNMNEISGLQFGLWTVLERAPNQWGKVYYHVRCQCGFEAVRGSQQLRQGLSTNCGCRGKATTPRNLPENDGKPWSDRELEYLNKWYPVNGARPLARFLERTIGSVRSEAKRRGIKCNIKIYPRKDIWSEKELENLKTYYPIGGVAGCLPHIRFRTKGAIKTKAYELKIRMEKTNG